jgi:hypothetical protein
MAGSNDAPIVSVSQHAYELSKVLGELFYESPTGYEAPEQLESCLQAANWLNIAAGILSVSLDTSRYDESIMYCGRAAEYEDKNTELMKDWIAQLVIFGMIWNAFERIGRYINPVSIPKEIKARRTPISDLLYFLTKASYCDPIIPYYSRALNDLRRLLEVERGVPSVSQIFTKPEYIDHKSLGAHVVRTIRNELAHGDRYLPIPENWGGDKSLTEQEALHGQLISASSRILLVTIQMLLMSILGASDVEISDPRGYDDDSAYKVVYNLHLDDPYPDANSD